MEAFWALGLFVTVALVLLVGYPVAITLGAVSLWFAFAGWLAGWFDADFLMAMPNRVYGIMTNVTLMAVPVFIFMGLVLEKAKLAQSLLENMAALLGGAKGGLGFALLIVGALLAASTGIVGATVVTLSLLALPVMKKNGYDESLSAGTICATGTLGQIIPPSIVLVLLGDVLSNAYQQAQLDMGIFSPKTVSVGELFAGAIVPGLILLGLYGLYWVYIVLRCPHKAPAMDPQFSTPLSKPLWQIFASLLPPLLLIIAVLGSIISGVASPTEAASVGAVGALLLAYLKKQLSLGVLMEVSRETVKITSMIFMILIGAALFSLVFKGFHGNEIIAQFLLDLPGGKMTAFFVVMLVMFILGFILDFIEITFVIVPIVGPILLSQGFDPVWLGIMFAINLQTSFLTPPFGFALFYLKGVSDIDSKKLYKGVIPFILIQILVLLLLVWQPKLTSLISF